MVSLALRDLMGGVPGGINRNYRNENYQMNNFQETYVVQVQPDIDKSRHRRASLGRCRGKNLPLRRFPPSSSARNH